MAIVDNVTGAPFNDKLDLKLNEVTRNVIISINDAIEMITNIYSKINAFNSTREVLISDLSIIKGLVKTLLKDALNNKEDIDFIESFLRPRADELSAISDRLRDNLDSVLNRDGRSKKVVSIITSEINDVVTDVNILLTKIKESYQPKEINEEQPKGETKMKENINLSAMLNEIANVMSFNVYEVNIKELVYDTSSKMAFRCLEGKESRSKKILKANNKLLKKLLDISKHGSFIHVSVKFLDDLLGKYKVFFRIIVELIKDDGSLSEVDFQSLLEGNISDKLKQNQTYGFYQPDFNPGKQIGGFTQATYQRQPQPFVAPESIPPFARHNQFTGQHFAPQQIDHRTLDKIKVEMNVFMSTIQHGADLKLAVSTHIQNMADIADLPKYELMHKDLLSRIRNEARQFNNVVTKGGDLELALSMHIQNMYNIAAYVPPPASRF
jgi:hypothetical protein